MDALIKTPYNTGMYTLYDLPMKDAANNEILETLQTIYATGLEPDYDDPSEKEAMEAEVVNYDDRQVIGAIRQQLQRRNVLIAKNRNFALLPEEECLVETVCARKYYTYYKDNEVFNINYEAYGSFYVTNQRLVFVDEKNNVESCPISEIIAYSTLDLSALVFKKADNTSILIDYTLEGRFVEVPKHLQRQGYYDKVFYDERARCLLALQKVLPDKYDGLATIRKRDATTAMNKDEKKDKKKGNKKLIGCLVLILIWLAISIPYRCTHPIQKSAVENNQPRRKPSSKSSTATCTYSPKATQASSPMSNSPLFPKNCRLNLKISLKCR